MSKTTAEGGRDFPASKVFADLIDKGPGRSLPEKPAPVDEQAIKPILDSLHRLTGFTPPTKAETPPPEPEKIFHGEGSAPPPAPVERADFLHLVPAEAKAPKGRQPKKIHREWPSDPESFMEIGADVRKRTKAQGSDAGHEATVRRQELRKQLHLPPAAPPWKELQRDFMALTEEDTEILRQMGYKPERITNLHSLTVERMLADLQRYRKSQQNTE